MIEETVCHWKQQTSSFSISAFISASWGVPSHLRSSLISFNCLFFLSRSLAMSSHFFVTWRMPSLKIATLKKKISVIKLAGVAAVTVNWRVRWSIYWIRPELMVYKYLSREDRPRILGMSDVNHLAGVRVRNSQTPAKLVPSDIPGQSPKLFRALLPKWYSYTMIIR